MIKKNPGWQLIASFENNANKKHQIYINEQNLSLEGAICCSLLKTLEHLQHKNKKLIVENQQLFKKKCAQEEINTKLFNPILKFK